MSPTDRLNLYLRYLAVNFASLASALITAIVLPRILKAHSNELSAQWFFGCQIGALISALTAGFGMVATRIANREGQSEVLNSLRRAVGMLACSLTLLLTLAPLFSGLGLGWPAILAIATIVPVPLGQVALAISAAGGSVRGIILQILLYRALPVMLVLGLTLVLISKAVLPHAGMVSACFWAVLTVVAWCWFIFRSRPAGGLTGERYLEIGRLGLQSGLYQWTIVACVLFLKWSRGSSPSGAPSEADYVVASAVFHLASQLQNLSNQLQAPQVALFSREPLEGATGRGLMLNFMHFAARTSVMAIIALQWFCHLVLFRVYDYPGSMLVDDMILSLCVAALLRLCMTPFANGVFATPHSRLLMPILIVEAVVAAGLGGIAWYYHQYRLIAALPAIDAVVCWVASLIMLRQTQFHDAIHAITINRRLMADMGVGIAMIVVINHLLSRDRLVLAGVVSAVMLALGAGYTLGHLRRVLAARQPAATATV